MIQVRKAGDRGHANHGWLDTYHSFSFSSYYDPKHMGFRDLRVINEDRIEAGMGFGKHPHRDMEIITFIVSGSLEHGDSMGNRSTILPGEIQRMSAGSGVTHSEFNHSKTEPVHLLQIWIETAHPGMAPGYEQKRYSDRQKMGEWCLLATPDGRDESIKVYQDVNLYALGLVAGGKAEFSLTEGRYGWLQVIEGSLALNGTHLEAGDGAAIGNETHLSLSATKKTNLLFFDLN